MIIYCDYINGDDINGDGTATAPYKTITKATSGLTGGDEVRVAKSPAPIDLGIEIIFTNNSTTITSASSLFVNTITSGETDTSVRLGDFVKDSSGNWWEIIAVVSDTEATLFKKYSGPTESYSSQKLGVTSTGEAPSVAEHIQEVSASGTSETSMLKISGGWDLSSEVQDGETFFRQLSTATFANRYGFALYFDSKSFIELEKCSFLRYYRAIMLMGSSSNNKISNLTCNNNYNYGITSNSATAMNNTISNVVCNSNGAYGIMIYYSSNNIVENSICNSNNNYGIWVYNANKNSLTDIICNSNNKGLYLNYANTTDVSNIVCGYNSNGLDINNGMNNMINGAECSNNSYYGIYLEYYSCKNRLLNITSDNNTRGIYFDKLSNNNILDIVDCENSGDYGLYSSACYENIVNNFTGSGNTSGDVFIDLNKTYGDYPAMSCEHFNTEGNNICFYEFGKTLRNTTEALSTQCLNMQPTSDNYYISQSLFFAVDKGVQKTISMHIKKDSSFDGLVEIAIFFMGKKISGWDTITLEETFTQESITASDSGITEDGVIELKIKTKGTGGNIYIDNISVI